jgi:hypothetical protein
MLAIVALAPAHLHQPPLTSLYSPDDDNIDKESTLTLFRCFSANLKLSGLSQRQLRTSPAVNPPQGG